MSCWRRLADGETRLYPTAAVFVAQSFVVFRATTRKGLDTGLRRYDAFFYAMVLA